MMLERLVRFCETDCSPVAEYEFPGIQIGLPDGGEISAGIGIFACSTRQMGGIADYRVQTWCHLRGCGGCRVKRQCVPGLRHPVVLHMEYEVIANDLGAQNSRADRAFQVSGRRSHGCC